MRLLHGHGSHLWPHWRKAFLIGSTRRHNLYEKRKTKNAHSGDIVLLYSIVFIGVNRNFWLLQVGGCCGTASVTSPRQ